MLGSMSQRMIRSVPANPRWCTWLDPSSDRLQRMPSSANVAFHGSPALVPHQGAAMNSRIQ